MPAGRGPDQPRAAEIGDLLEAVWAIPAVQQAVNHLLDEVAHQFRRRWRHTSVAGRALAVSWGAGIGAAALAGVATNPEARTRVFDLIVDRDIPVPGIDGLTFRLRETGAEATYEDIGGSGVSVRGGGWMGPGGNFEYQGIVTLDVAKYLPDF